MKIDLHLHTKSIKKGENKKRNVDKSKFLNKLRENNVKYVAITNHNNFDLGQFNDFSINDCNILVWPGVEADVIATKGEQFKSVNIIVSPSLKNELNDICSDWKADNSINSLKDLVEMFDRLNPIYSFDYKSTEKRRFSKNEIDSFRELTKNPIIADINKNSVGFILNFRKISSFIGSDLHDWDDYEKDANDLADTEWNFSSFEDLWLLLKSQDIELINKLFSKISFNEFDLKVVKDNVKIKIYDGINIIFGSKGTGKSEILDAIEEDVKNRNSICFKYKANEKSEEFKKEFPSDFNIGDDVLKKYNFIDETLEFFKNFSYNKTTKLANFVEAISQEKRSKYKAAFISQINTKKSKKENKLLKDFSEKLNNLLIGLNDKFFEEFKTEKLMDVLCELKNKILSKFISINKSFWEANFVNQYSIETARIVKNSTGSIALPKTIGLFDLWKSTNDFKNNVKLFLDFRKIEPIIEDNIPHVELPDKGTIKYIKTIKPWNEKDDKNWHHSGTKETNKSFVKYMESIQGKNFIEENMVNELKNRLLNEYRTINKSNFISKKGSMYNETAVNNKKYLESKDGHTKISDGEQSIILLNKKLDNDDYEYILLDEPSTFLGGALTTTGLLVKLKKLRNAGKKIVIVTHDGNLGLNTIPINMIYRRFYNDKYETFHGNLWVKKFISNGDFIDIIANNFEGGFDAFEFRKELYESKIK